MRNASLLRWLLLLAGVLIVSSAALAQVSVGISVHVGPPALPVYEQPACPGDGFIWIPGYWYWGPDGYFWVPGTWVIAPQVGFLWTPAEQSAAREQHVAPTTLQSQHERASGDNRALLASSNHGRPAIAATAKPGVFSGRDVVAARAAAPNGRAGERPATAAPAARGE